MYTDNKIFFPYPDYSGTWNQIKFVTLNEFIYLIHGIDPLEQQLQNLVILPHHMMGYEEVYIDFNLDKLEIFQSSWKMITRLGCELPKKPTAQIDVQYLRDNLPHYEASFLTEWAASKNIKVNEAYIPPPKSKDKEETTDDTIHPKKLKSLYTILLATAVIKYSYDPKSDRNQATGGKAGSIKADVQALEGALGRSGLNLDIKEDTVKKLLDEAVDALLN
jgi:hypothetical protein